MVNDGWSGAEALENAFRVADQELRRAGRERDVFELRLKNQAASLGKMQGVIDGLRRAHEIVEAERDQARRERDEALRKKGEAFDRAVRAERERDKWKARAEAAEARTAPAVSYEHLHQEVVAAYEYGRSPTERVEFIVKYMCALFGVEAEPADPVEEKSRELYRVATPDARWETVADEYRRIARHVLGQEDAR